VQDFSDLAAQLDPERAAREQHNATNCRLLTLPAELRNHINGYVIANPNWYNVRVPFRPARSSYSRGENVVQVCRMLRNEVRPMLRAMSVTVCLKRDLTRGTNPNVQSGTFKHSAAVREWLDSWLPDRDLSKISINILFFIERNKEETALVGLIPETTGQQPTVEVDNGHRTAHHTLRSFVNELAERCKSEGSGVNGEDVRKLFAILFDEQGPFELDENGILKVVKSKPYTRPSAAGRLREAMGF